ncbi:aminoacyl tRNA synthase complex-interacting multifunctional protein 2 [Microplitis mediator]|uniref:aminoacyl tRNA synthase complex-interacting multifunctional protein 2 n=1 Tax=Microplitis mediator TaxID=375433 RepID=UPI002555A0F3|nr:aminoacyl tRNA synthase complex-interacting multifunctional protein 2 [Microplitis mediator]
MTIMYELKAIINHNTAIERSSCMYEMKNIHDDGDSSKHKCTIVSEVTDKFINITKAPLAEVKALEERQEKILAQLAELKEQVFNLCNVLNKNNSDTAVSHPKRASRTPVTADVVINVNPARPCYSLVALKKLWGDVDLRLSPYVHSSLNSKIPEGFEKNKPASNGSAINLSLIWKNVGDSELIASGFKSQPIVGEANILRYLVRLFDNESYEKSDSVVETLKIDRVLDLSYLLTHQDLPKYRQTTLNLLDKLLGTEKWFGGKRFFNVADVAAWSAIKRFTSDKLPSNLSTWYRNCENTFL